MNFGKSFTLKFGKSIHKNMCQEISTRSTVKKTNFLNNLKIISYILSTHLSWEHLFPSLYQCMGPNYISTTQKKIHKSQNYELQVC